MTMLEDGDVKAVHLIRFAGQLWRCSCGTRGVGNESAEAHGFDTRGTIETAGAR